MLDRQLAVAHQGFTNNPEAAYARKAKTSGAALPIEDSVDRNQDFRKEQASANATISVGDRTTAPASSEECRRLRGRLYFR